MAATFFLPPFFDYVGNGRQLSGMIASLGTTAMPSRTVNWSLSPEASTAWSLTILTPQPIRTFLSTIVRGVLGVYHELRIL